MMREKVIIKKVNTTDLDKFKNELKELIKQVWLVSFPNFKLDQDFLEERLSKIRQYLENDEGIIVGAFENNTIIGYIWFFKTDSKRLHINEFVVSNRFRGEGIGTMLMAEVYKVAEKFGINQIELKVSESNKNAVEFYQHKNFEIERYLLVKKIND